MGVGPDDERIEVSYAAKKQVPSIVFLALFGAAFAAAGVAGLIPVWLASVGGVEMAVFVAVGVVALIRNRRSSPVMRLDPVGVTVAGAPQVPWTDLREVMIRPMRPGWLTGSKVTMVLTFIPNPGIDLPGPPHYRGTPYRWGEKARKRWYGTNLTVTPNLMSIDADDIAEVARRWGGLPVRHLPHRPVRRILLVIAAAVILGLIGGGVAVAVRLTAGR